MFTGIISDVGRVRSIEKRGDTRITIETGIEIGSRFLAARLGAG